LTSNWPVDASPHWTPTGPAGARAAFRPTGAEDTI
jgi:hypothetical protein